MTAGNLFPIIDSFREQANSETIPEGLYPLEPQHINPYICSKGGQTYCWNHTDMQAK